MCPSQDLVLPTEELIKNIARSQKAANSTFHRMLRCQVVLTKRLLKFGQKLSFVRILVFEFSQHIHVSAFQKFSISYFFHFIISSHFRPFLHISILPLQYFIISAYQLYISFISAISSHSSHFQQFPGISSTYQPCQALFSNSSH